jgi:hypothetical protein
MPPKAKSKKRSQSPKKLRADRWARLPRDKLLDIRICDLGLTLEGSWLEKPIAQLHEELDRRGLQPRPHYWLSTEWFSPADVPGIAIPFYLAHPRLMRLERHMMLEVDGGNFHDCMKVLRHELGHVMQHAYQLQRRRKWQQHFGKSSQAYPDKYNPHPGSKSHVLHLDYWYAQSHPDEDFAETFAVWLKPRQPWRQRYVGWPALAKLEYVDELMDELAGKAPLIRSKARPHPVHRVTKTLRTFYEEKQSRYLGGYASIYDRDLKRLFSDAPEHRHGEPAAKFLTRNRREIRSMVSRWTGEYQFTLDQVLKETILRCRALKLRVVGPERPIRMDFAILLTVRTMHYLYTGRHWIPL